MDEKELEIRERELAARELRLAALEKLNEKGLPMGLAALINYEDADKCAASIDAAEELFRAEVKRQVDARLGAGRVTLPAAGVKDEDAMSDREYYALRMRKMGK